jgi:hypothetical protein
VSNDGYLWDRLAESSGPPPGSDVLWTADGILAGGPDMVASLWASADGGLT